MNLIEYKPPSTGIDGLTSDGSVITATIPILLPNGSAAAPALAFANDTDTGVFWASASALQIAHGGTGRVLFPSNDIRMPAGGYVGWSSNANPALAVGDTLLYRDAAGTLALRNGTNAQTFHVYNTYTDGSNHEAGVARWNTNVFEVGTIAAGTGSNRVLRLVTGVRVEHSAVQVRPTASDTAYFGANNLLYQGAYLSRWIQGSSTKALTESSATTFVNIAVAAGGYISGKCKYAVFASDGTDHQVLNGEITFRVVNKAGALTIQFDDVQDADEAASAGTLTATMAVAAGTNSIDLTCNAASSLTQTTLDIRYRLDLLTPQTVTPA